MPVLRSYPLPETVSIWLSVTLRDVSTLSTWPIGPVAVLVGAGVAEVGLAEVGLAEAAEAGAAAPSDDPNAADATSPKTARNLITRQR
jgi:hypothetical protein